MSDTIYPYTKDVLEEGMWVQKRNKQGIVEKLEYKRNHLKWRFTARVAWSHTNNTLHTRLYTTTIDIKYLKPIKPLT